MNVNYAKLAEFCEAYKVNYNVLCMYVREAVALQPPSGGEVRAWMRRWAFDGVDVMALPKKERPPGWQLRDVTEAKCLDDDVPLYTAPPSAPVGVIGDAIRHLSKWLDLNDCECESGHQCGRTEVEQTRDQLRALASQPAAVDGAMAARVLHEYVRRCIEHDDDAPAELRVEAMQAALTTALAQQPAPSAPAEVDGGLSRSLKLAAAEEQAEAWQAVCALLSELRPEWAVGPKAGLALALDAIRALAQQPAAVGEEVRQCLAALASFINPDDPDVSVAELSWRDRAHMIIAQQPAPLDDKENRDTWRALWLVLRQTGTVEMPWHDIVSADWSRCQVEQTQDEMAGTVRLRATLLDAQPAAVSRPKGDKA